jgi:uncharacterized protein YegJ (DUF2314 family)
MGDMNKIHSCAAGGLQTHHVFLDTDVYRQLGHNPESPVLKALGDQIAAKGLVLHSTDITFAEIQRQLHEFVGKAAASMNAARRDYGRWRHRHPELVAEDIPKFDHEKVADAAFNKLRQAAITEWRVTLHKATEVPAHEIFQMYFERKPPFEQRDSKEFPDAFVVRCLEKWCLEHNERMYIVTSDRAMTDAVKSTNVLLPIKGLAEVLDALASTETPNARKTAEQLLAKQAIMKALQIEIEKNIEELIPVYDGDALPEGEVAGHELTGDIEILDFSVISLSQNDVGLVMDVKTPLTIQVDYEDRSDAIYDKEDDIYFGAEIQQTEIEDEPTIRVFAKLGRKEPRVAGLRILTGEINVSEPYENYN